jgi:glyoxylase I family protein
MICNVNHVGIAVNDMDAMLEFYREAFGFEVARIISDGKMPQSKVTFSEQVTSARTPRVVMLRAGNCYIEVIENVSGEDGSRIRRGYKQLAVDVQDIDHVYERLKTLGVKFSQPAPVNIGYVKVATGFDPEGNELEIEESMYDWECSLAKVLK